jgi:hypothetical protein
LAQICATGFTDLKIATEFAFPRKGPVLEIRRLR